MIYLGQIFSFQFLFLEFRWFLAIFGDFLRFLAFFFNSYCSKEVVVAYHTNKTKLLQKSGFPGKNPDFFQFLSLEGGGGGGISYQ